MRELEMAVGLEAAVEALIGGEKISYGEIYRLRELAHAVITEKAKADAVVEIEAMRAIVCELEDDDDLDYPMVKAGFTLRS